MSTCWSEVVTVLAWTKQNTMQRVMLTVLEWPQSHATRKTINMITNNYEPQQKCRLGTVSKTLLGGLDRFYGYPTTPSASIMAQNIQLFSPCGGFLTHQWIEALIYLLDNIYIRFGPTLYRQIVGIPLGTNCAPLVAATKKTSFENVN